MGSVLSLVIAKYLFTKFPNSHEGYLTKIRTNLNKFKVSLQSNNSEDIQNHLSQLNSAMSKAVKKGIIKKQHMSRKLSSLSKLIKNN